MAPKTSPEIGGMGHSVKRKEDPICGMTVDVENAKYSSVVDGETLYFCCLRCKETFDHPQISQITQLGRKSV